MVYFGIDEVRLSPAPVLMEASDILVTQNQQDGVPMDGAQTLGDALGYAIGKGARLAVGTLPPDQAIPSESATDPTCADMVKRVLKWLPGTVSWFDYEQDPPALNFEDRTARAAQTLTMGGDSPQVQSATLQARPDLVLPGVTLYFLRKLTIQNTLLSTATDSSTGTTTTTPGASNTGNGYTATTETTSGTTTTTQTITNQDVNALQVDQYGPDPTGIGAMVCTVQLSGGNVPAGASTTPSAAFEPTPTGLAELIYKSRLLLSFEGTIMLELARSIQGKKDGQFKFGKKLQTGDREIIWQEQTQFNTAAGEPFLIPEMVNVRLRMFEGTELIDVAFLFRVYVQSGTVVPEGQARAYRRSVHRLRLSNWRTRPGFQPAAKRRQATARRATARSSVRARNQSRSGSTRASSQAAIRSGCARSGWSMGGK